MSTDRNNQIKVNGRSLFVQIFIYLFIYFATSKLQSNAKQKLTFVVFRFAFYR